MKIAFDERCVTAPRGFSAAGVSAGIKQSGKPDVALIRSDRPASAAGVFTSNRVAAACVRLSREVAQSGRARAVVVNSGNANACTGTRGEADARRMAAVAAEAAGVGAGEVMVCSTGVIGVPMPMDKVEAGVRAAARALSPSGGEAAARAIMTTDTRMKTWVAELGVDGREVRIGAMAKGAGMIEPRLATMLAFMTTDAAVEPAALARCLRAAAGRSFNCIDVDGSQSTNDTALILANGAAENRPLNESHPDWAAFAGAVNAVARELAFAILRDGEGATKLVTLTVRGAADDAEAETAARAVANSALVKTSWCGNDPNWGRIVDAVGYSGARLDPEALDVDYDDLRAVAGGRAGGAPKARLHEVVSKKEFRITVDLHAGSGQFTLYTCDLSHEYVTINAEYTT